MSSGVRWLRRLVACVFIADSRVNSKTRLCGVCGGQSDPETCILWECLGVPPSVLFHQCSLHVLASVSDAIYSQQLTAPLINILKKSLSWCHYTVHARIRLKALTHGLRFVGMSRHSWDARKINVDVHSARFSWTVLPWNMSFVTSLFWSYFVMSAG